MVPGALLGPLTPCTFPAVALALASAAGATIVVQEQQVLCCWGDHVTFVCVLSSQKNHLFSVQNEEMTSPLAAASHWPRHLLHMLPLPLLLCLPAARATAGAAAGKMRGEEGHICLGRTRRRGRCEHNGEVRVFSLLNVVTVVCQLSLCTCDMLRNLHLQPTQIKCFPVYSGMCTLRL